MLVLSADLWVEVTERWIPVPQNFLAGLFTATESRVGFRLWIPSLVGQWLPDGAVPAAAPSLLGEELQVWYCDYKRICIGYPLENTRAALDKAGLEDGVGWEHLWSSPSPAGEPDCLYAPWNDSFHLKGKKREFILELNPNDHGCVT